MSEGNEHGNTSAASIPLAFDVAVRDGRIKKNEVLLLAALPGDRPCSVTDSHCLRHGYFIVADASASEQAGGLPYRSSGP
jgi:hypothetical protein